jgi:cobalt-zinc-cadmium efflux system outer membrane protein
MWKYLPWAAALACSLLRADAAAAQSRELIEARLEPVKAPALVALVRDALERHPQTQAAEASLDAREALETAAAQPLFNPELETSFANGDTNDSLIGLSQTIDRADTRGARAAVAHHERETTAQVLAGSRRDLAVEVLESIAAYRTAHDMNALARQRAELAQRLADMARRRFDAGDFMPQSEVNVAQLAYARSRIEAASTASELAAAQAALGALTQRTVAGVWPDLPTDLPVTALTEHEIDALVAQAPTVRIAQELLAAADAEVELRESERHADPTVSLVGGREDDEPMIGVRFSMPLNVRNRYAYEIDAARAGRLAAERELANVVLRAGARLRIATERYALTREAWTDWGAIGALDLSRQTELLDRLLAAGELSLTTYLVQLDQTVDAQASVLRLRRDLWQTWFEWLAAAGAVGVWLELPIETVR